MVRNNDKRTDARVPAEPEITHLPLPKIYQDFIYMQGDTVAMKGETEKQKGWICPKCGKGVSPNVEVCPCSKLIENMFVQNG